MPRRLVLTSLLVILLSGCGGSIVPGSKAPAASATPLASATPVAVNCPQPVKDFLLALEDLDSRMSIGLNFTDYSTKVGDVKVVYDRIVPADVDAACLTEVGSPAEAALNDYVAAYNTWNDCVASTSCTNGSIKSQLQAKWADATDKIDAAKKALAQ